MRSTRSWRRTIAASLAGLALGATAAVVTIQAPAASGVSVGSNHGVEIVAGPAVADGLKW
jgi:hypothetical protein